jgi:molybdate transport system substrate-binding protein
VKPESVLLVTPSGDEGRNMRTMTGIRKFSIAMTFASGLAVVIATGEPVQAENLTIGAAPSLKRAFQEIVPMFEKEYGAMVQVVYGPSPTLRRQIEKGAPIDVFLPAAVVEVEKLHKMGLTLKGEPRVYAQTSLVLVMSATSQATLVSYRDVLPNRTMRLALGDPKTSSLGEITARALTKIDPAYKNRFQIVRGEHGEDVVNLVHKGEADLGIVYRVDAINSGRGQVRISDETPAGTHMPIQFGAAMVWTSREASLKIAEEFLDFIVSPRIQKLMLKYGFEPVSSNG